MKHFLFCLVVMFFSILGRPMLAADVSAGIGNEFLYVIGTRAGLVDAAACNLETRELAISPKWGALGKLMEIICDAKTVGLSAIPGSATGTVKGQTGGGGRPTFKIRVVGANSGPYTKNGISYSNLLQVWACNTGNLPCASVSDFTPLAVALWTHTSDGTNRGFFVIDNSLFEGQTAQTKVIELTYDFSSSLNPGTIVVRAVIAMGGTVEIRAEGFVYSNGDRALAIGSVTSTLHNRLTAYVAANNTGGMAYESDRSGITGVITPNQSASGDAPATTNCVPFTWTEATTGVEDRAFTLGSGSCSVTLPKNVADSLTTIGAYSTTTLAAPLSDTTLISANPASIAVNEYGIWNRMQMAFMGFTSFFKLK